jgi:hypothetical protein
MLWMIDEYDEADDVGFRFVLILDMKGNGRGCPEGYGPIGPCLPSICSSINFRFSPPKTISNFAAAAFRSLFAPGKVHVVCLGRVCIFGHPVLTTVTPLALFSRQLNVSIQNAFEELKPESSSSLHSSLSHPQFHHYVGAVFSY